MILYIVLQCAHEHLRKEGCNGSKVISSTNDGEDVRSPFINIA